MRGERVAVQNLSEEVICSENPQNEQENKRNLQVQVFLLNR